MENISISISLPKTLDQQLRRIAKQQGQTMNCLVQRALREFVDKLKIKTIEEKMQVQAGRIGIGSDQDVVELIHRIRDNRVQSKNRRSYP